MTTPTNTLSHKKMVLSIKRTAKNLHYSHNTRKVEGFNTQNIVTGYLVCTAQKRNTKSTIFKQASMPENLWTGCKRITKALTSLVSTFGIPHLKSIMTNTHYYNSNVIWRSVSCQVDEVIPSDHPRREASRVFRWYDLIHETWYSMPDHVTIIIICLLYTFSRHYV